MSLSFSKDELIFYSCYNFIIIGHAMSVLLVKSYMKPSIRIPALFMAFLVVATLASLFAWSPAKADVALPACTVLSHNMFWGEFDGITGGEVTSLQTFLNEKGYLNHAPTGFFGSLTYSAAVQFQRAYGIPTTGFVGPLTRAEIQTLSCASSTPVLTPSSVYISSVTPSAGPVGTLVTVVGFGFTNDNIVHFAGGAIAHVSATPGMAVDCTTDPTCHGGVQYTLTFTVPSSIGPYCPPGTACPMYMQLITPNTYQISIENANGTSNTASFTVTGA